MQTTPSFCAVALLGFAALTTPAFAQFPPVAFGETASEFTGRADLDGNGLPDVIIVDKVSGSVRVSYQGAGGTFQWDEPKASGISSVTGVTAGRLLLASKDALAVTSPEANRINVITPTFGGSIVPQSVFISAVGPNTLVAANLNGTISFDDLWVGSALNSAPSPGHFDQYVNSPAGTFAFNAIRHSSAGQFDSASAVVLKTTLPGTFAYMEHLPAGETLRVMSPGDAGAPVRVTLAALPVDSSYLVAPFAGATYASVLTWKQGDSLFASRSVSEPVVGSFTLAAPLNFPLPFPAGQLLLVPTSATTSKLLVVSPSGTTAAYFDFNGSTLSAPIETLTAPAGEQFTGGVALPGYAGFHLLRGAAGDGRTATSRYMKWNAVSGRFTDSGGATFAPMGKRSGAGNVMLFAGEPFVSPTATLVSRLNARDWSSGIPPVPPASLNITGEMFTSATQGLRSPATVGLGSPPAGTTHVLLNQYTPYLSFFSLSAAAGGSIGDPSISPPGGQFSRAVQLSFTAPAGMTVQFRDAGGSWTAYAPVGPQPQQNPGNAAYEAWWAFFRPLLRFKNTTIEYYGQVGVKRSPVKTATFSFSAPPDTLSSLGDGVPDYVKSGLHYNPLAQPLNLQAGEQPAYLNRLLPGVTDPRALTSSALDLFVRPMSRNGYDNIDKPSLLAGAGLDDGTFAAGNQVTAYDGGGAFLAGSDDTTPEAGIAPGLRAWSTPFAEPSARLSGLSGEGNGGFAVLATSQNFAIEGNVPDPPLSSVVGRELVAVQPLPAVTRNAYQRVYGGGTDAAEAGAWVTGATLFYNQYPVATEARTVDSLDTMALLVFERWLLAACLQRGFLPPSYTPTVPNAATPPLVNKNYLSLTAFRPTEGAHAITGTPSGAVFPTAAQLRSIEDATPPAATFRLASVIATLQSALRTSADPDISALRAVTADVYRISSRYANEFVGGFELPVDALRHFLATGAVPPGYGNKPPVTPLPGNPAPFSSLTDPQYTSARAGLDKLLALVQPRPFADFNLMVRADTLQPNCTLLDKVGGGVVSLVTFDGRPFRFPGSFSIAPCVHVQITAYTDLPPGPCGQVVEVVDVAGVKSARITSIPAPTPGAGDNLLPDDWELFFFGQTGLDPFASPPGSAVSYLQIYLDGKDPGNGASYSGLQAKMNGLPQPVVNPLAGADNHHIKFNIPPEYAQSFNFQLQYSSDLGNAAFLNAPESFHETLPGQFELDTLPGSDARRFWRVGFSLK